MRTILLLMLTIPFLAACGVTERRALVTGHDVDQVWSAMKAVAQTPDYYLNNEDVTQRWVVMDNEVFIDDDAHRMEVQRRVERELHKPRSPVRYEQRAWKFEIALEWPKPSKSQAKSGEQVQPVMLFRTRNSGVPAHAWEEAEMYFNEVEKFLGPMPAPAESMPAD